MKWSMSLMSKGSWGTCIPHGGVPHSCFTLHGTRGCPNRQSLSGAGPVRGRYNDSSCTSMVLGGVGPCRGVGAGRLGLAGAPGAIRDLVAPPSAPGIVPWLHHDRVLRTPPGLQAARDQPGAHEVLHKRGQASFRDHVQAHLVCSQTLLPVWVIDEETQLPVHPAPIGLAILEKLRHGLSPFSSLGLKKTVFC